MNNLLSLLAVNAGSNSPPAAPTIYADDVFSAYTYTGNSGTQTISNGIDLAGQGGLVWLKRRNGVYNNVLFDSVRGTNGLYSNTTDGNLDFTTLAPTFNSSGFSMTTSGSIMNNNSGTYAAWTFRKAAKFLDIVTWTGNGASSRSIPHALGQMPGMIIIKRLDAAADWLVWNRATTDAGFICKLNSTAAGIGDFWLGNSQTSTNIFLANGGGDLTMTNLNGGSYIAYVFGHDTSATGLIQCGSFTTDGVGNATVTLGWESQFVMIKSNSSTSAWLMFDNVRGMPVGTGDALLLANSANAESAPHNIMDVTATGFEINSLGVSTTYIYMAIRRPNKPPTSGTEVYMPIARTGTSAKITSGIFTDMVMISRRTGTATFYVYDRLRGSGKNLLTNTTGAEATTYTMGFDHVDGYFPQNVVPLNITPNTYVDLAFRRAPGVFDIVAYTGDGTTSGRTVPHSLGVTPNAVLCKSRDATTTYGDWKFWFNGGYMLDLNETAFYGSGNTNSGGRLTGGPTYCTVDSVNNGINAVNESGKKYVAYLFATKAGISKVGSYSGNGTTTFVDCGFTAGARLVIIKRLTGSAGTWGVWDSARGIVESNDPRLTFEATTAETSTDDIDPNSQGFTVVNSLFNTSGADYFYIAFA